MSARPTIRDVARRAGVSIATVSRALNEKDDVSPETRQRVVVAAQALGYAAQADPRVPGAERTGLVAIVVGGNAGVLDLSLLFFGKVLGAISRRFARSEYEPLLLQGEGGEGGASRHRPHLFDAAIVIALDEDDRLLADLSTREIPLVGVDVRCSGPHTAFVGSDHAEGVGLAIGHLHAQGHRRIAHIAGGASTVAGSERLDSFRREIAKFGLELPDRYVGQGDFSSASGYREACALLALPEPPTAIVAASDHMALAALQAIWESGREPGRDVAVVGFDDLEAAALAHPPLTTIRQDRHELGTLAAERAIELVEDPDAAPGATILPVELVVRASSVGSPASR